MTEPHRPKSAKGKSPSELIKGGHVLRGRIVIPEVQACLDRYPAMLPSLEALEREHGEALHVEAAGGRGVRVAAESGDPRAGAHSLLGYVKIAGTLPSNPQYLILIDGELVNFSGPNIDVGNPDMPDPDNVLPEDPDG